MGETHHVLICTGIGGCTHPTELSVRRFPVAPDPFQLALDGSDGAFELRGDLGVCVTLELPESDLTQAGVFEHLEPTLQGLVEQGGLGGGRAVGVDLVEDRARQVLAGAIRQFGRLPAGRPAFLEGGDWPCCGPCAE